VPTDLNALPLPEKRNTAYTYNGNVLLVPLRVFDDGASTYMKWADGTETPAVYALGADGTESIINYANRGDYLVIEQVARAFVLRRGKDKATLYNDAYHVQGLDADSPKPRKGGR
jgi:type IV secretion system protein VirB9